MNLKIKKYFRVFALSLALFQGVIVTVPQVTYAATTAPTQICEPDQGANSSSNFARCFHNIYLFTVALVGSVSVLMFVVAGYMYMTGDEKMIGKAKGMILRTIIAIVILLGTFLILNTLDPNLTKIPEINVPKVDCSDVTHCQELPPSPINFNDQQPDQPVNLGDSSKWGASGLVNGFFRFNQAQSPWGPVAYTQKNNVACPGNPSTSTIAAAGCGPTALAQAIKDYMLSNPGIVNTSVDVNPATIAKISSDMGFRDCGNGTAHAMFATVAPLFNLKATTVTWDQAENALRHNYVVIAAMGPGKFTSGGHFITLNKIEGQTVYTADSGPRNIQKASINEIKSQQHFLAIIGPK